MASVLALCGALPWGVGDFFGGLVSRRLAVLTVLAVSQAVGLAGVLLWVWIAGDSFPGVVELAPATAAGIAGLIGLGVEHLSATRRVGGVVALTGAALVAVG